MTHKVCIHHWQINAEGTRGQCKFCGTIKIIPSLANMTPVERRRMQSEMLYQMRQRRTER